MNDTPDDEKWSLWGMLRALFLAGFWLALVLVVATLINVLFNLNLAFDAYGSSTPLPGGWEGVLIMVVVALFFGGVAWGIVAIGTMVKRKM
ncbi:MAG: hypothetical protein JW934_04630 [Anaerolineae bacterium]|nr:hypothetical protein [Anaerolineae bacterium]